MIAGGRMIDTYHEGQEPAVLWVQANHDGFDNSIGVVITI